MSTSQGVAGVWDILLTRPGNQYSGVFTFTPTGVARTGDGAVGTWWRSPAQEGTFSYRMEDNLKNPEGQPAGKLQMNQTATLEGDTFEGSGIHYVFSPEGEQVAEVEVQITGKRR
jgi:hypothetical protein